MRVSREEAAKNREKVVKTSGRLFRRHGYDGIGIAGLMKAAGLTHGGFYKQFKDKDALAVESTEKALEENRKYWREVVDAAPDDKLAAITEWYLSDDHRDWQSHGCTFASLAAEAPRHSPELQNVFGDGFKKSLNLLTDQADGPERAEAIRKIACMVGTLILARAVGDNELSSEILAAGRKEP